MVGLIGRAADAPLRTAHRDTAVRAQLRGYRMAPLSATVLDLSASGAIVEAEVMDLRVGDEVVFVLGTAQSVATIIWLHTETCGITFHRRIEPIVLAGLRRMTR